MKKIKVFILLFCLLGFSSCSIQERVSPEKLKERLAGGCADLVFEDKGFYIEKNFYDFAIYKNIKIAFKFVTDDSGTVYKVSESFIVDDSNTIQDLIEPIISVYSPKEDFEKIKDELLNREKKYNFSYGKEHNYSLINDGKSVYFEVYNNRLSNYSIPELTLKENDKQDF